MSTEDRPAPARTLPRAVRWWALAIIVAFHLFLLGTSQDPLRLNVGDPWSEANVLSSLPYVKEYGFGATSFTDILDVGPLTFESYRYTHYPPLSEIMYGALHAYAGVDSLGTMRLFAIGFSALAMWLLFSYVRRLFDDGVALIATMLWSCNLLWMMYADMIHQAPVMQATGFLALWGLVRALDDGKLRHWAAAWFGCCACFLTSYDYLVFLPTAVMMTVYLRRGNPFRPVNWKPWLWCASGCLAGILFKFGFVIGAVGWQEFLDDLHFQFLERSTTTFEQHTNAVFPTLTRRATMVFSPLFWGLLGYLIVRIARAGTRKRIITEGLWLAFPALAFLAAFSQLAASQMLALQVALPFYAICSAIVLARLVHEQPLRRYLAIAILIVAPLWSGFWLMRQERSYLDEPAMAKVRAYLDEHDKGRDWIMCNLLADGPIQAYVGRHYWPAFSSEYYPQYHAAAIDLMNKFGRDDIYVLLFTDPRTRMIDKSLWPIAMPRRQWSLTGSHLFWQKKGERMIRDYDQKILDNLREVNAETIMSFPQVTLYRITREAVMRATHAMVPEQQFIDFGSYTSERYMLAGWLGHYWDKQRMFASSSASGQAYCPWPTPLWWGFPFCRTVLTKTGLVPRGQEMLGRADLVMRASRGCDGELIVHMLNSTLVELSVNDTMLATDGVGTTTVIGRVPRSTLVDGVNVISIHHKIAHSPVEAKVRKAPPDVTSVELKQACHSGAR